MCQWLYSFILFDVQHGQYSHSYLCKGVAHHHISFSSDRGLTGEVIWSEEQHRSSTIPPSVKKQVANCFLDWSGFVDLSSPRDLQELSTEKAMHAQLADWIWVNSYVIQILYRFPQRKSVIQIFLTKPDNDWYQALSSRPSIRLQVLSYRSHMINLN